MKLFTALALCALVLNAASVTEFETLEARFEQTVTNEHNQSLRYSGQVWLKKPDLAYWRYETPIDKTIYIQGKRVVIVEPELFQATRFESDLSLNILDAWGKSRAVKAGERIATVGENRITLRHNDAFITQVDYRDTMDNEVLIRFFDQRKNPRLDPGLFIPAIPEGFDLIVH